MKLIGTLLALSLLSLSVTAAPAEPPPTSDRAAKSEPYIDIRSPSPRTGNRTPLSAPRIGNRADTGINPDAILDTVGLGSHMYACRLIQS